MQALVLAVLTSLLPRIRKLGDEIITKGFMLALDALTGRVTDEQLFEFLRERAKENEA